MTEVHLLSIGIDPDVVRGPEAVSGDAYQRQLKYASILASYRIVARTLDGEKRSPRRLADNWWVYPTGSRNRLAFVKDAVSIGSRLCREHRPDVLSTQDPFASGLAGYLLKRRFGIPLSLQFAGDMVDNPHWLRERRIYPLMNRVAHWLIPRADTYRVVSIKEQQKLVDRGIPPERIWNLGWITDFSRFLQADGAGMRRQYLGDRFSRLVLFAGRLVPAKDLPTLMRAVPLVAARQPDVLFLLVGAGPEAATVRRMAGELGVAGNVVMAGEVAYDDMPAYFAASDVFVLPSVREGNARVLAEAAAAAKPAVATDVSGTRDTVLDGETGFVVPAGDPQALAEGLLRLLQDPAQAEAMGGRGREHILALYSEQRLLAGFAELWETTAKLRKR